MLTNTGRREQRSRLLPALSWYFVMAMAVFRDGRAEVLRRLTEELAVHAGMAQGMGRSHYRGYFAGRGTGWVKHH